MLLCDHRCWKVLTERVSLCVCVFFFLIIIIYIYIYMYVCVCAFICQCGDTPDKLRLEVVQSVELHHGGHHYDVITLIIVLRL